MLPRRTFLSLTGVSAAAAACGMAVKPLSAGIAAGPAAAGFSLGFSLYGMKSIPLAESLLFCRELGYEHVELCLNSGFPAEPATFSAESRMTTAAQLQKLGLAVPCVMVLMSLTADEEAHRKSLELISVAARLAVDVVPAQPPILETVLGGSPTKWQEQRSLMAGRLQDWAKAAESAGTTIALKAHVGSAVNSPERLLWLLEQVPSAALQVAYDYSHFQLQGMDLEQTLRPLLSRTRLIHVKDSEGTAEKFRFLLPGAGGTDYVKYFSLLGQLGYTGPVCVEVSGQVSGQPGYDARAAARQCFESLNAARQKAAGLSGRN